MQLHLALIVFAAVLGTLFVPVPEELTLLGAGYLARTTELDLPLAYAAALLGILVGDVITFFGARWMVPRLLRSSWAHHWLSDDRRRWADALIARHGTRTVVFARFLVGLRGPVYAALGASSYRARKFLGVDTLAALLEVGILVALGYWLGPSDRVVHGVREVMFGVIAVVLFSVLVPLVLKRWLGHAPR